MQLNFREYNKLGLHQKALLIDNWAIFIGHHHHDSLVYTLYSYSNYYIELIVDSGTNNLLNIVAFKDGKQLDKYLDCVSLRQIGY